MSTIGNSHATASLMVPGPAFVTITSEARIRSGMFCTKPKRAICVVRVRCVSAYAIQPRIDLAIAACHHDQLHADTLTE